LRSAPMAFKGKLPEESFILALYAPVRIPSRALVRMGLASFQPVFPRFQPV